MVPQYIKCLVDILRCDSGPNPCIFNLNGDEPFLVFPFWVILEPVIKMVSIDSPGIIHIAGILNANGFHFIE